MPDILNHGQKVLKSQPFSVYLGAELTRFEVGLAEISIELRPEHKQQYGFAHGGVVSYLADNAMTFAGGTVLAKSVTLEMKINYTRPAVGERLIARATVLSSGKSQAVCRCDIFAVKDGTEKLCAAAQGTIALASPGKSDGD